MSTLPKYEKHLMVKLIPTLHIFFFFNEFISEILQRAHYYRIINAIRLK